ncbi:hypothetical protein WKW79_36000 [Variovorax robiniae]|uniref:Big-1 domain-containing protein n=1 Tax=Variovorax robiniae TaxID=1836199 RepID=A0ABU8XJW2_9BURK
MAALFFALANSAHASVTYQYTGNPFVYLCQPDGTCYGPPATAGSYTRADRVTATVEVSTALPSNLSLFDLNTLAGTVVTLTDGHQTLHFTAGDSGSFEALVSTDASGQIVGPWSFIINCCFYPNNGIATLNWPGNRGVGDSGTLSAASPNNGYPDTPYDAASNSGVPGTWTVSGGGTSASLSYGSATRVMYQGPFSDAKDIVKGAAGAAKSSGFAASTLSGTQSSRAQINANGPSVGAWSNSANGSGAARAIAFRTYINNTNVAQTFKVNATFDGRFDAAPFGLPTGQLKAGAAIHVFDAQAFATKLGSAGNTTAQFLVGSYPLSAAADPLNAFSNLRALFPQGLLGSGQTVVSATTAPVTASVATGFVTVAPQKTFTVMYDVSTSSIAQTVGDRTGGGTVNFLNTLAPAAVQFTNQAGQSIAGIVASDTAPPQAPAPTSIVLAPAYSTGPAGATASITATVTAGVGTPVADLPVQFSINAGPDKGRTGVAVTDPAGKAIFQYVGDNDVGKDVIQANIAGLQSNTVEYVWSPAKCPQNQLFWLRYPGLWPASTISIGGAAYDQTSLVKLLKLLPLTPSVALLQQDAITKLNTLYGSDTSRLTLTVLTADDLLTGFNRGQPYQNLANVKTSAQMLALAARMAVFNSGATSKSCR